MMPLGNAGQSADLQEHMLIENAAAQRLHSHVQDVAADAEHENKGKRADDPGNRCRNVAGKVEVQETRWVSLTHEQALIEYDPAMTRPELLLQILRDIGYTISDLHKLRAFEAEGPYLVRESGRFVTAAALSIASIPLIADPFNRWYAFLPPLICLSLAPQSEGLPSPAPPVSLSWLPR